MNGHAVGLGLTLALQCDLRIAADEGKYGVLQVRRGVMPDATHMSIGIGIHGKHESPAADGIEMV